MSVLVTGGTGFVGSHLIEHLRAAGEDVRALVRPTSNRALVESLGATPVVGDLDDGDSLQEACAGCDRVYHSAAHVDIVGSADDFQRTTVDGTERLVVAAREAGVRRFVHLSSCGVYHPRLFADGGEINEFTETPEPPKWFAYGRAKYHAERVVREQATGDMEWVILRLAYLYGPRNHTMRSHLEPAMRDSMMAILGDGQNKMAFIYVIDVVKAIVLCGTCPEAAGQVLIAGPNEYTTQQTYFDAMADGFGMPRIKKRVPYKVAFFFGWLGELFIRSGPRRATIRRAAIALTGLPQNVRCDHTQKLLNWTPEMRFEEGIRTTFDWFKDTAE